MGREKAMLKINVVFLEEYKHLDSLCKEKMPGEDDVSGVTRYINAMDATSPIEQSMVDSWHSDYKAIKHLRWVRNKLAHDEGSMDEELLTKEDVAFLKAFYKRVKAKKDPLSLIKEKPKQKKPKAVKEKKVKPPKEPKIKQKKPKASPAPQGADSGESLGAKIGAFFKNILKL